MTGSTNKKNTRQLKASRREVYNAFYAIHKKWMRIPYDERDWFEFADEMSVLMEKLGQHTLVLNFAAMVWTDVATREKQ